MAKEKATQIWKFTKTQILLLTEQAIAHAKELEPFQNYQARAQNDILVTFKEELGIPENMPLTVDLDNLQFTFRDTAEVIPFPTPAEPVLVDDSPDPPTPGEPAQTVGHPADDEPAAE